jgi:hypothetical protein
MLALEHNHQHANRERQPAHRASDLRQPGEDWRKHRIKCGLAAPDVRPCVQPHWRSALNCRRIIGTRRYGEAEYHC